MLPVFPVLFMMLAQFLQSHAKSKLKWIQAYVLLSILIEVVTQVYFVAFHEIGAFGPIAYLAAHYPGYQSLITNNKFEGNYLSLTHSKSRPSLFFVNHDPPFVQHANPDIPLI